MKNINVLFCIVNTRVISISKSKEMHLTKVKHTHTHTHPYIVRPIIITRIIGIDKIMLDIA